MEWSRRTVPVGDVELAVFEAGPPTATTVLLVHGWPDTHHVWTRVAVHLVALGCHVVSYDTRGAGDTTDPGTVKAFRLEHLADDLLAVADAMSPDRPVHVVGHDWGSVQGWEAVCREGAAARFASFTTLSGPCVDHLGHWLRGTFARPSPTRVIGVLGQVLASWYIWLFLTPLAPVLLRRLTLRRWQAILHRTEGIEPREGHHGPTYARDVVRGVHYYRANVLRRLWRPGQRRTRVPVLLLVLTRDRAIRPVCFRDLHRWVDRLERRELPFGHWVVLGRPDLVAEEVATFVGSSATSAAGQ